MVRSKPTALVGRRKKKWQGGETAQASADLSFEPHGADGVMLNNVGYLIRQTFFAFTRSLEARLTSHDVTVSMWFFLRLLWTGDGQTQQEMSAKLRLAPPTTVNAMDILEARGFVCRRRNPKDRRKVNIYLTNSGRQLEAALSPCFAEVNRIALLGFSKSDETSLRKLLERALSSLEDDPKNRPPGQSKTS